jgi:oligopeptide/dipeptide ABC transporter ATP-binding protein
MYLGRIVELGPSDQIYGQPRHPYTQLLLASIPRLGQRIEPDLQEKRQVIFAADEPYGRCRFSDRCPEAFDRCHREEPELIRIEDGCQVACHLFEEKIQSHERDSD